MPLAGPMSHQPAQHLTPALISVLPSGAGTLLKTLDKLLIAVLSTGNKFVNLHEGIKSPSAGSLISILLISSG